MMLLANTRNVPPVADGMSAGLGRVLSAVLCFRILQR